MHPNFALLTQFLTRAADLKNQRKVRGRKRKREKRERERERERERDIGAKSFNCFVYDN